MMRLGVLLVLLQAVAVLAVACSTSGSEGPDARSTEAAIDVTASNLLSGDERSDGAASNPHPPSDINHRRGTHGL
jgi:hypothetical protein